MSDEHLHRHRHDLRPLRGLGDRGGPGDPRRQRRRGGPRDRGPHRHQRPAGRRRRRAGRRRRGRLPARHEQRRRRSPPSLVGLAVVFAAALGIGNAVGPVSEPPASHDAEHDGRRRGGTSTAAAPHGGTRDRRAHPGRAHGLPGRLHPRLTHPRPRPAGDVAVSFTIIGPGRTPGHGRTTSHHEKQLHLIAVRRDFTGFQHVHPVSAPTAPGPPARPHAGHLAGLRRLQADRRGPADARRRPRRRRRLPAASRWPRSRAQPRWTATPSPSRATCGRRGRRAHAVSVAATATGDRPAALPGAYGHLVALREGDLAYLHVHPDGTPGDGKTKPGPDVVFYAAVPERRQLPAVPRLQARDVVRTARSRRGRVRAETTETAREGGDMSERH